MDWKLGPLSLIKKFIRGESEKKLTLNFATSYGPHFKSFTFQYPVVELKNILIKIMVIGIT